MRKLSVVTWIGNAAAVLWGRWGDVSRQAETAGCSRQTVYQHARRVQQAVAQQGDPEPARQELLDQIRDLRRENRQLWNWLEQTIELPKTQQRQNRPPPCHVRFYSNPLSDTVVRVRSLP